jgi:drug/metabolite transporter (DMT)-like permease
MVRKAAGWCSRLIFALLGVTWVLGGEHGLNIDEITRNVVSSPLSYILAFVGAFIWATYCTVTAKYARGKNGITLFVLLTALTLWLKFMFSDQPPMIFSWPVVIAGDVRGGAGVWLCGLERRYSARQRQPAGGRLLLYPGALSALAAVLLSAVLSWPFWQGAGMVCAGSLLCWYATRR